MIAIKDRQLSGLRFPCVRVPFTESVPPMAWVVQIEALASGMARQIPVFWGARSVGLAEVVELGATPEESWLRFLLNDDRREWASILRKAAASAELDIVGGVTRLKFIRLSIMVPR
jgi:hypothetical protein